MDDLSNKSNINSENSLTIFEVRSSDEESTLENNRFTKANEYHAVPPLITGNPLTPRADISFAGLDEYAFRNKIIESKITETNKTVGTSNKATIVKPKSINETVVSKSKINRDEVIIEDWISNDEDDVCANKTVSSVKPNVTQAVRSQANKSGQTSQKQGIGFKKASKIAQSNSVIRPKHLRLDIVRPKASNTPINRSYFTQPGYKPKDLKPDVKTFGIKNMTTVGTRAVVSKGKVENVLKKAKWDIMDLRMDRSSPGKYNSSMVYKHNMVAFLKKPNESVGFTEVVDFLKGTSLSKLQLADATGIHNLSDAEIYAGLATLGYLAPTLTKKLFANMKRGYAGDIVPLLPAMLAGAAVDQGEGSAQPAEPHHTPVDPIPSTSQPPHLSPQPQSPPHLSPPRSYKAPLPEGNTSGSAEDSMQLKELIVLVPTLVTRINSLEKELKDTKQTLGNAVLKLVKKVKSLETALKRKSKKVLTSESEGEAQEEEISPTILEAAKTLLKVASQGVSKEKSTNKGKRYRRKAREEINTGREEINTGIEEVSTGGTKRGQREGKALMIEEDIQATHKTKEQMRQEEAGLEEAIKLQAQLDEEVFYTEEDWDTIRAKLEANAELTKSLQGENVSSDDFAKRMVDMINQKKKYYAEQKAKAKRDKPMTQAHQRDYMSTYIKNQSSWKMLEQESSKKQKIAVEDVPVIEEKVEVVKKEEPIKRTGKRKKQKARKGTHADKTIKHEAEEDMEALVKSNLVSAVPVAIKPPSIANWKIIKLGNKGCYGTNGLEDEYERVFWGDLKNMFDPPLSTDPVWNLPYQQKMLRWRYYDTCRVHCLTLESADIYMLTKRRYLIPADVCQAMFDKKLQRDKKDKACYQLLKLIEKQAQNKLP
ncbi:hypothetical protein Tco_0575919 [Tanacetum coccineum]